MKDLYIVGGGGMGRKVLVCIKRLNQINPQWNIKGFLDDNQDALVGKKCDYSIVGSISGWRPTDGQVFVMGIADPKTKHSVAKMMKAKGAHFETIVSPDVIMGDFVEIGEGSIVMTPYNVESCAQIGRFVTLLGSTIAIDGVIGDFSTSTGYVNLTVAKIGKGVYVGSHAVILEHVTVGDGAVIGAGSIVTHDVDPFTVVYGSPARTRRTVERYLFEI